MAALTLLGLFDSVAVGPILGIEPFSIMWSVPPAVVKFSERSTCAGERRSASRGSALVSSFFVQQADGKKDAAS